MSRIVVIDKDKGTRTVLGGLLNSDGYDVHIMAEDEDILGCLDNEGCDVVVSSQEMEPVSGMDILTHMHSNHPDVPVILLTASPSMDQATQALKLGVFDYITKPFKIDIMTSVIDHAISHRKKLSVGENFREILGASYRLSNTIAASSPIGKVCDNVERMAPLDMPVLIEGPAGSGKTHFAGELHALSARAEHPIVFLECKSGEDAEFKTRLFGSSSQGPGALETASKGTIVFEAVDQLSLGTQNELYELIKNRTYTPLGGGATLTTDARLVFTSDKDLGALAKSGSFSTALFGRLGSLKIELPALKDHLDDVLHLAYHVFRRDIPADKPFPVFDKKASIILSTYSWPGNVAELFAVMTDLAGKNLGKDVTMDELPGAIVEAVPAPAEDGAQASSHAAVYLKKFLAAKAAGK
jgi:DNA-binding NtrC family response regulator